MTLRYFLTNFVNEDQLIIVIDVETGLHVYPVMLTAQDILAYEPAYYLGYAVCTVCAVNNYLHIEVA